MPHPARALRRCAVTLRSSAGLLTLQYFQAKEYNWVGLSKQPTLLAKVRRAATQLLPHSVEQFDWRATAGPSSFLECAVPVLVVTASELNAFFLKYALWVPPENPINTYRIIIWFGAGKDVYTVRITRTSTQCSVRFA